jgi:hypothetical protein
MDWISADRAAASSRGLGGTNVGLPGFGGGAVERGTLGELRELTALICYSVYILWGLLGFPVNFPRILPILRKI